MLSPERPTPARPRVRATRQGSAVEAILAESNGFRTAQELHAELRRRGDKVGLTTVYRHLSNLADLGVVDSLRAADGESLYRLCATAGHHHHVVCRRCGQSVEVDGQEAEAWVEAVAHKAGFTDVSHTLEVFGTCAACSGAA